MLKIGDLQSYLDLGPCLPSSYIEPSGSRKFETRPRCCVMGDLPDIYQARNTAEEVFVRTFMHLLPLYRRLALSDNKVYINNGLGTAIVG